MIPRTLSTARRILTQVRHDRRTVALVLVVPLVVLTLVHALFDGREPLVSRVLTQMLVVFPLILMFLLTAIVMVRERTSGTLERLMTTPVHRGEIVAGYSLAFAVLGLAQVAVSSTFAYLVLGLTTAGSAWGVFVASAVAALLGVAFGLLASAVARSEFQAIQFFPAFVIPQLLLCGLFGPREEMAGWLHALSSALPLSYAADAVGAVFAAAELGWDFWGPLLVTTGFVVVLLAAAGMSLRRRT